MSVIKELIRLEDDGSISFGNYLMDEKKKVLDFEVMGNLYKVKTYKEITKLEMPVDLYKAYGSYHYGIYSTIN